MHNKGKYSGIMTGNSIQRHRNNHGIMPRTCTVGSRYNDCNTTKNKQDKSCHCSKILCKPEAIKCNIEMQIIAYPYTYCINNEQNRIFYFGDRQDTVEKTSEYIFYPSEKAEIPEKINEGNDTAYYSDYGYIKQWRRKYRNVSGHVSPRIVHKSVKELIIRHECRHGKQNDAYRINYSFSNYRTQRFGKRNSVISFKKSAS